MRTPNRECEWCTAAFYGKPSAIAAGYARFCSRSCLMKSGWAEKQRTTNQKREGINNPNYKHGKKMGVNLANWSISKKPGNCRSCGSPGTALHHAIPRTKAPHVKRDLRNGIPLCAGCHKRWHEGAVIRREVFTEEEWEFISNVELIGERIEEWLDKRYPSASTIRANALDVA